MWKIYYHFRLNKIVFFVRCLIRMVHYSSRSTGILYDLEYFSKVTKHRVCKDTVDQLSKISSIVGVINYGGTGYHLGISDIDWLIVLDRKKMALHHFEMIDHLLKNNAYLSYAHPPLLVDERLMTNVLRPLAFNYISRHNQYRKLYQKEPLLLPRKRAPHIQRLLFDIEKYFMYQLGFNAMKRNFNKRIPLRATLKMLKNNLCIEFPIFDKLSFEFPSLKLSANQKQRRDSMRLILERIYRGVEKHKVFDQTMNQQVISLLTDTLLMLEWYTNRIIQMNEVRESLYPAQTDSQNIRIVNSELGWCVFVRDYSKKCTHWIYSFLRSLDIAVFDMQLYHYIHTIEQQIVLSTQKESRLPHGNVAQKRASHYRFWWIFLKKHNLIEYSDVAPLLRFIKILKKPTGFIERMAENMLNYVSY